MNDSQSMSISQEDLAIVADILLRHVPHYAVLAYGSRTRKDAKPYSDLDLAIVADRPLTLAEMAAIKEDFSESDLPWKVDIVDWSTTGPEFQKIIKQEKVVLQDGEYFQSVIA